MKSPFSASTIMIWPRAVVVGTPTSSQMLYVADTSAPVTTLTVRGSRSLLFLFDGCQAVANPRVADVVQPAIGGANLDTLGQRPFRVAGPQD